MHPNGRGKMSFEQCYKILVTREVDIDEETNVWVPIRLTGAALRKLQTKRPELVDDVVRMCRVLELLGPHTYINPKLREAATLLYRNPQPDERVIEDIVAARVIIVNELTTPSDKRTVSGLSAVLPRG